MVKETNWERQIKKPQNESMRKQKLTQKTTIIWLRCGSPWIAHQAC